MTPTAHADMTLYLLRGPRPIADSRAVDWFYLICRAESFTERTGWGLATFWAEVQRGNYTNARMDRLDSEHSGGLKAS